MATTELQDNDEFLVNRDGESYHVVYSAFASIENDDLLLVNRDGIDYSITGERFKDSTGGLGKAPVMDSVTIYDANPSNTSRYTGKDYGTIPNYSEQGNPTPAISMKGKVQGALPYIPITDTITSVTPESSLYSEDPYTIDYSFYVAQSILERDNTAGRDTIWTFSCWLKISEINKSGVLFSQQTDTNNYFQIYVKDNNEFSIMEKHGGSNILKVNSDGSYPFIDTNRWYHFVFQMDTEHINVDGWPGCAYFIDGVKQNWNQTNVPALAQQMLVAQGIGVITVGDRNSNQKWPGYIANPIMVNAQVVDPSEFGETNSMGQWVPKDYVFPTPNQTQNWSANSTVVGTASGDPNSISSMYDGNTSLTYYGPTATNLGTSTVTTAINPALSGEILLNGSIGAPGNWQQSGVTVTHSGGTTFVPNDDLGFVSGQSKTVSAGTYTDITSIEYKFVSGGSALTGMYFWWVSIGGQILVNQGAVVSTTASWELPLDPYGTDNSVISSEWPYEDATSGPMKCFDGDLDTQAVATNDTQKISFSSPSFGGQQCYVYCADLDSKGRKLILNSAPYGEVSMPTTFQWLDMGTISVDGVAFITSNASSSLSCSINAIKVGDTMIVGGGIGYDSSGNGNDFEISNTYTMTSPTDSPTSNYCTINKLNTNTGWGISNGNLGATHQDDSPNWQGGRCSIAVTKGKYYFEVTGTFNNWVAIGVAQPGPVINTDFYSVPQAVAYANSKSIQSMDPYPHPSSWGSGYTTGDTLGVAFEPGGDLLFYVNGVSQGVAATLQPGQWMPAFSGYANQSLNFNFGQYGWAEGPPDGYQGISTATLSAATVAPRDVFDVVRYQGNGGTLTQTGLHFEPGFTWLKGNNVQGSHMLFDQKRGVLEYISTDTDGTQNNAGSTLTEWTEDGYKLGDSPTTNGNNNGYLSFNWKASTAFSTEIGTLTYDKSQEWSDGLKGQSSNPGSYPLTALFDGNVNNGTYWASSGDGCTFTGLAPITQENRLVLYGYSEGNNYILKNSDGNVQTVPFTGPQNTWLQSVDCTDLFPTPWTLTDLMIGTNFQYGQVTAIEIGGKILVDTSVTPPTLPTIASSGFVDEELGFSVATYLGNSTDQQSVAHGLSTAPEMVWTKNLTTNNNGWAVYSRTFENTEACSLDNGNAPGASEYWSGTTTTNVVQVGDASATNSNSNNAEYVQYSFSPREGVSAMGKYQGNNIDNFIYTGFSPAFIIIKDLTQSGDWQLYTDERRSFLNVNTNSSESQAIYDPDTSSLGVGFMNNGFAMKGSPTAAINSGTDEYLWIAFAREPLSTTGSTPDPLTWLGFTTDKDLQYFHEGDVINAVIGDQSGKVAVSDKAGSKMQVTGDWSGSVGDTVRGQEKNVAGSTLYLKMHQCGDVEDLLPNDPGWVICESQNPVVHFPDDFDSGNAPDYELPEGTAMVIELKAENEIGSNSASSGDYYPSTYRFTTHLDMAQKSAFMVTYPQREEYNIWLNLVHKYGSGQ